MRHTAHGYWLEEAGPVEALPSLEGEIDCDVAVIGGGYTGLWTAWQLSELEPGARVALVEAGRCGHGPSGRNGGFVNGLWFSLPTLRDRYGDGPAIAVARAAQEAADGIGRFCEQEGVDAWFRRAGAMQVSAAPAQDGRWDPAVAACRELGEPGAAVELTPDQVAARCLSPALRAGVLYRDAATVQPARLAIGLRERLRGRENVSLFERSPMRTLRGGPRGCTVELPGGRLRAGACVLAIGSATGAAGSPLRGRLTVTSSHMVITEPVPDLLEEIGWTGGECITDCRAMVHYFRTTPDGRIAFGWGGGRIASGARLGGRTEVDPAAAEQTARALLRLFPGTAGRAITHAWGGPIDVSPTHLPAAVQIGSDPVYAAFGFTGNGVGPSRLLGRILASLALERRDDHSRLAIVDPRQPRVPTGLPGWLGGNTIRAGLLATEAAEDRGIEASPVHRWLARVPELIGVQVGR